MGHAVALDNPLRSVNVGSVLRVADRFGASLVAIRGARWERVPTDTDAAYSRVPLLRLDDLRDGIPFDHVPVAVEIVDGAESLPGYVHPRNAYYVFGAEDATLGHRVLSWCRDVVRVPTRGCLNLSHAVAVVLYDRMAKGGPNA